jgi:hypothetical protein
MNQQVYTLPHGRKSEFTSSAWIAHNATMAHKKGLLTGMGVKPKIGSMYEPKPEIQSAVEIPVSIRKYKRITAALLIATHSAAFLCGAIFVVATLWAALEPIS